MRKLIAGCLVLMFLGAVPGRVSAQTDARADILAAAKAYDEGNFDVSIKLLTGAIASGQLEADALGEAHWNRGVAYERAGDRGSAFADIEAFSTLFPADGDGPSKLVELAVQ